MRAEAGELPRALQKTAESQASNKQWWWSFQATTVWRSLSCGNATLKRCLNTRDGQDEAGKSEGSAEYDQYRTCWGRGPFPNETELNIENVLRQIFKVNSSPKITSCFNSKIVP